MFEQEQEVILYRRASEHQVTAPPRVRVSMKAASQCRWPVRLEDTASRFSDYVRPDGMEVARTDCLQAKP